MGVGAHVHGLLLAPHELGIGVAPELPLHQIKGEGTQLQHTTHSMSAAGAEDRGGVGVVLRGGVEVVLRGGVGVVLRSGMGVELKGAPCWC